MERKHGRMQSTKHTKGIRGINFVEGEEEFGHKMYNFFASPNPTPHTFTMVMVFKYKLAVLKVKKFT